MEILKRNKQMNVNLVNTQKKTEKLKKHLNLKFTDNSVNLLNNLSIFDSPYVGLASVAELADVTDSP